MGLAVAVVVTETRESGFGWVGFYKRRSREDEMLDFEQAVGAGVEPLAVLHRFDIVVRQSLIRSGVEVKIESPRREGYPLPRHQAHIELLLAEDTHGRDIRRPQSNVRERCLRGYGMRT